MVSKHCDFYCNYHIGIAIAIAIAIAITLFVMQNCCCLCYTYIAFSIGNAITTLISPLSLTCLYLSQCIEQITIAIVVLHNIAASNLITILPLP